MTHETLPLKSSSTTAIEVGSTQTRGTSQPVIEVLTASPQTVQNGHDDLPVQDAELVEEAQSRNAEHNSNLERLEQAISSLEGIVATPKNASEPLRTDGTPESPSIDRTLRV